MREQPVRKRDPERRARILEASATLISRHGYHAVAMADIGAAAGIVGSGIYRHFESKSAILAELLAEVMARLEAVAAQIATLHLDDRAALTALIKQHVQVAVHDRYVLRVYYAELQALGETERRQLRRAQRRYLEEWVTVIGPLRPDLADSEVRLLVHGAIGLIQSILFHDLGVPEGRVEELLVAAAHAGLGVAPAPCLAVLPAVFDAQS
ncbi:MAG TPA: TetR/AcrR family transcriptional regulator [Sporichthyaceae bacterium]|jgi:AcrR family transcriptional regulator